MAGSPLALTFDNLGEAAALERGTWPAGRPLGRDRSVTEALPRLLALLDELELRATFFVEAINAELYPDALREIAARGHELGHHGWRHERWDGLAPAAEEHALVRGLQAFAALGLTVRGFRPPGGNLNPGTCLRLRRHGLDWCSPAERPPGVCEGVRLVPFRWELVDAYHLLDHFEPLRRRHGDPGAPLDADALPARLLSALRDQRASGEPGCLILHPFVGEDPAGFAAQRAVLEALRPLGLDPQPGRELGSAGAR